MAEPYRNVRGDRQLDPDRLPGGASTVKMITGMDGMISSNKAAAIELKNVASLLAVNAERTMRMTTSLDNLVKSQAELIKTLRQSAVTGAVVAGSLVAGGVSANGGPTPAMIPGPNGMMIPVPNGIPSTANATGSRATPLVHNLNAQPLTGTPIADNPLTIPGFGGGVIDPDDPRAVLAPGTPSTVSVPGFPRTGTSPMPGRTVPGPPPSAFPEGHDPNQVHSNYDRLMKGRHYSISQLRTDATRRVGQAISSSQFGPSLTRDESGKWMRVDRATGQIAGEATAADIRNLGIANRVRTIAGGVAEQGLGKGLLNALPEGVGSAIGGVGAAIAVGNQVANFAEKQREENAYYQGISGGSNLSGFNERLNQNLFRFSQRGVMGGAQADELYKGVRELSLGSEQQDALNMATENWRKFGVEVSDSIKMLRIEAQSGQHDFAGLADSIGQVTATARASGMNANEARADFTSLLNASSGTLTGQGTAATLSSVITQAKTTLGAQYSNLDLTGMFSQNNIRMLAAQNGMTSSQFLYRSQGLSGASTLAGALDSQLQQIATRVLGQNGMQIIAQYKAQNNITGQLSEPQVQDVARLLVSVVPDVGAVQQQLAMVGVSLPDLNDVLPLIVRIADKSFNFTNQIKPMVDAAKTQKVGAGGMSAGDVAKRLNVFKGTTGLGASSVTGSDGSAIGGLAAAGSFDTGGIGVTAADNTPASIYYDQAVKSGTFSPLIEKAIKDSAVSKDQFRIRVGNKSYDMSLSDALRYHSDQLARGDVQVVDKDGKVVGTSLADTLGVAGDSSIAPDFNKSGGTDGKKAVDLTQSQKAGSSSSAGGTNVGVTIGLTAEAKRLLTVSTSNGALTSSTPSSSVLPQFLPGGN